MSTSDGLVICDGCDECVPVGHTVSRGNGVRHCWFCYSAEDTAGDDDDWDDGYDYEDDDDDWSEWELGPRVRLR